MCRIECLPIGALAPVDSNSFTLRVPGRIEQAPVRPQ
jgi:hypothetical protein